MDRLQLLIVVIPRMVAEEAGTSSLRKAGTKIATNGSLNLTKKHSSPARQAQAQASQPQSWQEDAALAEEGVDEVDSEEGEQHYATVTSDQHTYTALRKGPQSGRYQRNPRANQLSHFSQFSRLPPGW